MLDGRALPGAPCFPAMLTVPELAELAMCARIGAQQSRKDAEMQSNPVTRKTFEDQAERREKIAAKLEQLRQS